MTHRSRVTLALLAAGVLALILRLVYLAELGGSPFASVLMGDARGYDAWARQIAGGQWIGTQVFYQTPLYPYLLAIVFRVVGHDITVVRGIQALAGAASCVLVGVAGRQFFNDRVGVIAALMLAVYPSAIFFDGLIQKSSLDTFLVAALLAALGLFQSRPKKGSDPITESLWGLTPFSRWGWLVVAAVAMAAFTLNRENARVLYPVIGAWVIFAFRNVSIGRRAAWLAAFAGVTLLLLVPVGLRNYKVGGAFLLSTSQMGPNFFIGNNPGASGSYEPLVPGRGNVDFERVDATALAERALGRKLSASEVSDYWFDRAWTFIRTQPLRWLALMGRKLLLSLNASDIADTESIQAYADYSFVLQALLWLDFGVILPMAVLGAWLERENWRRHLILYAMIAALGASVVLFYVVARYRYPIAPMVLLFSASAVAAAVFGLHDRRAAQRAQAEERPRNVKRAKGSRNPAFVAAEAAMNAGAGGHSSRDWTLGLAAAAVVAVVSHVPMNVVHDETYMNLGSVLVESDRPAEAVPILRKAVAADPGYARAHFALGLACAHAGDDQSAVEEFTAAIRLRADDPEAHNALGMALGRLGRRGEALEQFREAARLGPEWAEAHANVGLALMQAGNLGEAVPELQTAVRLAPDNAVAHNGLAGALQQTGDVAGAIAQYNTAIRLKPDYAAAHSNLAGALTSQRDYEGALRHFNEAIRLDPQNYGLRMNLAAVLLEAGRTEEAIAQYREAVKLSPESVEGWYLSAGAYLRAGRRQEALASLESALSIATRTGRTDATRQIEEQIRRLRSP